jgi:hypothetical protein
MSKSITPEILAQIAKFCETLERFTKEHFEKHFPNLTPPVYYPEIGNKYTRIVKEDRRDQHRGDEASDKYRSRSVMCFVRNSDGVILKAASWKAPAKHDRGSIFAENCDVGVNVDTYGARYLR